MSRFGVQPARQALTDGRWTYRLAAERLNVPPLHLRGAVLGHTAPSSAIRDRLPVLLGRPLSGLFTREALAAKYNPGNGPGGRQRPGESWITSYDA